jgi:hypothetical protein
LDIYFGGVIEISDIIQILHPNKALGPDVISHKMLKLCPNNIALPLQIIFNKSLHQSKYHVLKRGEITRSFI